ncbi:MAG: hypothetical protein K2X82_25485 [Gemmataceae bacterium]|nr:hypothetical protein [Gemmataceae bacterium]
MRVQDALDQLDAIHEHLAKAEVYRGFRVPAVALVGTVGLFTAVAQSLVITAEPIGFVWYWLAVAGVGGLIGGGAAGRDYLAREDDFARRRTRQVFAQFGPCLFAGGVVTAAATRSPADLVAYLPGLWAVLFGLGIVAARPYLPRGVGKVGLGYVAAGGLLLARTPADAVPPGWAVGGVFGVGHLLTALVLWADRRRDTDG